MVRKAKPARVLMSPLKQRRFVALAQKKMGLGRREALDVLEGVVHLSPSKRRRLMRQLEALEAR